MFCGKLAPKKKKPSMSLIGRIESKRKRRPDFVSERLFSNLFIKDLRFSVLHQSYLLDKEYEWNHILKELKCLLGNL